MKTSKTNTRKKDAKGRTVWEGPRGGEFVMVNGRRAVPATGFGALPHDMIRRITGHLPPRNYVRFATTSKEHTRLGASRAQALAAAASRAGGASDAAARIIVRLIRKCLADSSRDPTRDRYVTAGSLGGKSVTLVTLELQGDAPFLRPYLINIEVYVSGGIGHQLFFFDHTGKIYPEEVLQVLDLPKSTEVFLRSAIEKAVKMFNGA
jgi:hypothetical protein